ncbi:MAG: hypothetical protein KAT96_00705 [Candidatus Omnitrophica bacterium]|nr:hypothetical protein [Candidatus Omnitrophota bacterium]
MKFIILFILFLVPFAGFCEGETMPVVIDGDEITYLQQEGKVAAKGNVEVKSKDTELFCQEIVYDANTNIARIKGDAKIVRGDSVLYGRDIIYDFTTHNAEMEDIRIQTPPFYGATTRGSKVETEKYILKRGYMTTCDLDTPHYRLTAKKITVYPGDRVVAKHVVLRVGDLPLFYLPYMSQSLKDSSFAANVVPGQSDEWGTFILTRWRYTINRQHRGNIFTDWYNRRGLGLGITHKMENTDFGQGLFKYYGIQDNLYRIEERYALLDTYSRSERLEDDRYKAQFAYQWDSIPNLSITSEFNKFSDQYFMKDFFELEYEEDMSPLSYTLINYSFPGSSLSLLAQKRVNRFFSETEYLPQLEWNFYKKNIGQSKFYFESIDKLGNLNNTTANSGSGDDAVRFHSKNLLSYNDKIRWLRINPYIGATSNFYSRNAVGDDNLWQIGPELGMTLSAKMYKYFLQQKWSLLGEKIDEMRHIVAPEVTYSYALEPTLFNGDSVFSFDEDDSLSRGESVVFTLANKLQLRNKKRTWDFIYFSPAVTYSINPEGGESRFTTITSDFEIYPREGISLTTDTTYDVDIRRISIFNADLTFSRKMKVFEAGEEVEKDRYSFTYGHRYSRQSSTQGTLGFSCQLTPKLQFSNYLRYEYNTGDLQEQQYKIRTDLHCWWMDIGLGRRRRDEGSKDTAVWIAFTLKAFPDIGFEIDQTREGGKKIY